MPLPPIADVKRAAPMSQKIMDMNNLVPPRQLTVEGETKELLRAHNQLNDDGNEELGQGHEHHKEDSREDSP